MFLEHTLRLRLHVTTITLGKCVLGVLLVCKTHLLYVWSGYFTYHGYGENTEMCYLFGEWMSLFPLREVENWESQVRLISWPFHPLTWATSGGWCLSVVGLSHLFLKWLMCKQSPKHLPIFVFCLNLKGAYLLIPFWVCDVYCLSWIS